MPSISLPTAAVIGGVGALGGGVISALGANKAASTQANALNAGITTQINEFQDIANAMSPYANLGQTGASAVGNQLGTLTTPFQPTMAQLQSTPGYQFTLNQGEQGVANAYSGQGLGSGVVNGQSTPSGPMEKGAINYAEGLASTTYQQQFQNYLQQNAQIFNTLMGTTQLGEQSIANLGGVAQNSANTISGLQSASGAAQAAGIQSGANALGQGLTGLSGGVQNFALLNALGGGSLNANVGAGALASTGGDITQFPVSGVNA